MLTSDELAQIVKALRDEPREGFIENRRGDFHIPEKDHYDSHLRLAAFFKMWDGAASQIGKFVLVIVVGGLLVLVYLGIKWKLG